MKNRLISLILSLLLAAGMGCIPVLAADTAVITDRDVEFAEISNLGDLVGGIGGLDAEDMSVELSENVNDRAFAFTPYERNTVHTFSFELYPTSDFTGMGFYVRGSNFFFNRRTIEAADLNMNAWNEISVRVSVEQTMELYVNGSLRYEMSDQKVNDSSEASLRMAVAGTGTGVRGYMHNPHYTVEMPLPEGYTPPSISIACETEKVTESEAAVISADVSVHERVSSVEFFVDGESVSVDTQAPYELSHIFAPGEYEVYAIVTDNYNSSAQSNTITVNSLADTRPRIETSLVDGESYERSTITAATVTVRMSEATLAEGHLSVDGTRFASLTGTENTIDLSGLSMGAHDISIYAENNLGESAVLELSITVVRTLEAVVYSNTYENSANVDSATNSRGYIRYETINPEFGNSVLLGCDGENDVSLEGPWVSIPLSNCNTRVVLEFDMYVERMDGTMFAMFATAANNRSTLFQLRDSRMYSPDNSQNCAFSDKTWHHVILDMDMKENTYDMHVDGTLGIDAAEMKCPKGSSANWIRMISQLYGVPNNFFALDNMTVTTYSDVPYIYKITSPNGFGDNIVSAKDNTFTAYFNAPLAEVSVYASKFSVAGAEVVDAVYNAADTSVTIELAEPLKEGSYQLVTAENLVIGSGELYGEKLYARFQVAYVPITASDAAVSESGVFSAVLNNGGTSACDVYVLMNMYQDNVLTGRSVRRITLRPGENTISQAMEGYSAGATVRAAVWDSIQNPYCILFCENNAS